MPVSGDRSRPGMHGGGVHSPYDFRELSSAEALPLEQEASAVQEMKNLPAQNSSSHREEVCISFPQRVFSEPRGVGDPLESVSVQLPRAFLPQEHEAVGCGVWLLGRQHGWND